MVDRRGFATPTIHLRPAGDAGADPVTHRILSHDVTEQPVGRLGVGGVWPWPDQGHRAVQHVQELRQLVDRELADDPADAGDTRIVLGGLPIGQEIGHLRVHGAELITKEQTVVETHAWLPEQDGAR